jgi:hypothetical protein
MACVVFLNIIFCSCIACQDDSVRDTDVTCNGIGEFTSSVGECSVSFVWFAACWVKIFMSSLYYLSRCIVITTCKYCCLVC